VLRNAGISRAEYDAWLTARLLERRLGDKFKAEAGATAAQLRLARIRVADEASANRVREQATGGADFAQLARDSSLDQQTRPGGGELGWRLPELLEPEVRDAVAKLGTGDLAVVRSGRLYDVYKVLEASPARELDAGLAGQLATRKVDDWVKAELVHLRVKRELSADEDAWIREEVGERLQRAVS
jgi:parvulin-like peptidyl-prolyl isomerase